MKKLTKKQRNRLLIVIAAVILVFASLYTAVIKPYLERDEWVYEETEVFTGDLIVNVSESGSLEYGIHTIDYDVDVQVDEDEDDDEEEEEDELVQRYLEIEKIHVAAGQQVEKGQQLLTLSKDSVASVRRLLQTALVEAASDYAEAEDEYNLAVIEAQISSEMSAVAGKYAQTIYNNDTKSIANDITLMEIEITQRIANRESLQEALDEASENLAEAKEEYLEIKENYEAYFTPDHRENFKVGQTNFLNAQNAYERALSAVTKAQENIETNETTISELSQEVKAAKAAKNIDLLQSKQTYIEDSLNAESAQLVYLATVESLEADLLEAREEKEAMEEKLAAFEELVGDDGILTAPEAGLITAVNYEEGDTLETTGSLFSYTTNDDMTISVAVTQEDVIALKVSDDVAITFNAYPDEEFRGTIASIDTTATSAETPTVSYSVVTDVEGDLNRLFGGMTAKIDFAVAHSEDTIYISRKALVSKDGKYYVYKKTGLTGKELTEVTIGLKNESYVEIVEGISEQDTIYIATLVSGAK